MNFEEEFKKAQTIVDEIVNKMNSLTKPTPEQLEALEACKKNVADELNKLYKIL